LDTDVGLGMNDYKNILATVTGTPQGDSLGAAKIVAWIIFGAIGFVAFSYGAKIKSMRPMLVGGALMVYPYFVAGTWPLYIIGAALTAALYYWRE
jgi:hypothetical protein